MEIIVLSTEWEEDFWEKKKKAPYRLSAELVERLGASFPRAGIGVYRKGRRKDLSSLPPCFIIIQNIEKNDGEFEFVFRYLSKVERLTSVEIANAVGLRHLVQSIPYEKISAILERLHIKTPLEWQRLLEPKPATSWLDWIGKHFQTILQTDSTNEYEDIIAETFKALGFDVEQMGYKKGGECADGIAYSKDFAIIYDCKMSDNYFLNTDDKRAMKNYIQMEKKRIEGQKDIRNVHFAFVARSYANVENLSDIEKETSSKGLLLTAETLLYLLFKKLSLGRSFYVAGLEQLISNNVVAIKDIERIYGR